MKRFVVTERGSAALPALDLDGDVVIGSGPSARLRLPAQAAREEHVRIEGDRWSDGDKGGPIGEGVELEIGNYLVHVAPSPPDATPSPPQRTESLARELVRGLLGSGAVPTLELVRGPGSPSKRELPPPAGDTAMIIGRGDEATWIILDEDLSREHAEIRRGWDGVTVRDLGSKNGTRVNGKRIADLALLADGARLELANCELVFRDPAERHLQGTQPRAPASQRAPRLEEKEEPLVRPSLPIAMLISIAITLLALIGLGWVMAS